MRSTTSTALAPLLRFGTLPILMEPDAAGGVGNGQMKGVGGGAPNPTRTAQPQPRGGTDQT